MNKSVVFKVYLEPLEIEFHDQVGDRGSAIDEALKMIQNGEIEIDEVDFWEERDCECGSND